MKNKTIRKVSLFTNLVLITALAVISMYIINLNKNLKEAEYRAQFFVAEMVSRDLYMGVNDADPKQATKGLKMPKVASSTPKVSKDVSSCNPSKNESVNQLLNKHFKTCKEVKIIHSIAQAESSGKAYSINKNNRNGSWDCGYLQVNTIHRNKGESKDDFCERMHNLDENIALSSKVYKQAGNSFVPWVTYNTGAYLAYMK